MPVETLYVTPDSEYAIRQIFYIGKSFKPRTDFISFSHFKHYPHKTKKKKKKTFETIYFCMNRVVFIIAFQISSKLGSI